MVKYFKTVIVVFLLVLLFVGSLIGMIWCSCNNHPISAIISFSLFVSLIASALIVWDDYC